MGMEVGREEEERKEMVAANMVVLVVEVVEEVLKVKVEVEVVDEVEESVAENMHQHLRLVAFLQANRNQQFHL